MTTGNDYFLPRTAREARRLQLQSALLREATETVLAAVGLVEGMACLDVGCGSGDAMQLIAGCVGASGRIVGVDLDTSAARPRIDELTRAGAGRLELHEGDLFSDAPFPGEPFDLTFSRYVLHHMPDPAAALASMWRRTRPGGWLAVIDIDSRGTTTFPRWPPYEEIERLIAEVYRQTGVDTAIGHKLPHLFEQSGVGNPDGAKVVGVIPRVDEIAEFLELLLDMIRDKALEIGAASEADLARLARELATASEQRSTYCMRPLAVGVWKRKPL